MNYELFVAKRIIADKNYKNSVSSPIIKIAITAIALGISIMLIAISIAGGFQEKIRDKIAGFKGHIQITNYDNNNSEISLVPILKKQEFYPEFKSIEGISHVQVFANKAGIIRTAKTFEGIVFKGVDSLYDTSFFKEYLQEGSLPNFKQARNKEILISTHLASKLQIKVGDTVQALFSAKKTNLKFKQRKPIIVGLYNTGFQQFDEYLVLADIREIQRINSWRSNEIGGFEVIIDDFNQLKDLGTKVYQNIGSTLNSQTILDNYPAVFDWIHLFDNNVRFILLIMILIAGVNMITALLVLILERIQLIGILKALGSVNTSIQKIFLYNAAYLIFRGLLIGNGIALVLLLIQKFGKVITLDPTSYYVATVPVSIDFVAILLLNIGTLLVCLLILIIPSLIITKIEPTKSIKFA